MTKNRLILELPDHLTAFCDANILIYAFVGTGKLKIVCTDFLARCAEQKITLYTSPIQVSNTIHRAMVNEAVMELGIEQRRAASYLKQHPDVVKSLRSYKNIPRQLSQARIQMLDVTYREIHASKQFRDTYGLMAGDSIIVALMQRHRIRDLASNDEDFKRIPQIRLWTPD
ncbi:MAG: PIN domain-containing protein [Chloroflexota bacterium]